MTKSKIQKLSNLKSFLSVTVLISIALTVHGAFLPMNLPAAAAADGYISLPGGLCGEGAFPCPEGDTAVIQARNLAAKIVLNVRLIIGAVAVLMIVISGIKMVVARGNEETFTKERTSLSFAILGLMIVGLAGEIAQIFEVDRGGFLKDPNVSLQKSKLFTRTVEIVITLIKYVVGSMAVLYIVRNGMRLILMGGNEEEVAKDKKNIYWGLIGLVVILVSNPIINKVFFKINTDQFPGTKPVRPGIDTARLAQEMTGMTNIIAAIAGPIALLVLVAGGLMYILAGGEEEKLGKAKKIITWALVGLILIYGSFAIVSTFVARQFSGI